MNARAPVLEARDVSARYGARTVPWQRTLAPEILRGVSLVLAPGERLAIVGESGSGKTTLLRVLLRLLVPARGQVLWEGMDLAILSPIELRRRRSRVQMIFQDPIASLDPAMRVADIVAEPLRQLHPRLSTAMRHERAATQLAAVGLSDHFMTRRPAALSGGQAQRVSIARALLSEPAVLVCDEPVSALDASLRAQVLELLVTQSRKRGLALLFVTHDLAAASYLCERMLVMQRGEIVEAGATAQLLSAPRHAYTRSLRDCVLPLVPGARGRSNSA